MSYEFLGKIYYKNKESFKTEFDRRKNGPFATSLGLEVYGSEAFYVNLPSFVTQTARIYKKFAQLNRLCMELPDAAYKSYEKKCLVDEIILSNDIEGIHSTRKEILTILDEDRASSKKKRFEGMVKKYRLLLEDCQSPFEATLSCSRDIRALYDDIVLDEIASADRPDGELFRKDIAEVISGTQQVKHVGLFPESEIIRYMDRVLRLFNNDEIPQLYKIAILHYFMGYIHPFYDGNGRLSRFLSSYLLKQEFNSLVALRLSYAIKDNKREYYKAFDTVNDPHNMGDLTPFIIYFSDVVEQALDSLLEQLGDGKDKLNFYAELLSDKYGPAPESKEQKRTANVLWYLVQNEIFASEDIDKKQLAELLGTSVSTAHNYVEESVALGAPIYTSKSGKKLTYELDLDKMVEWLEM